MKPIFKWSFLLMLISMGMGLGTAARAQESGQPAARGSGSELTVLKGAAEEHLTQGQDEDSQDMNDTEEEDLADESSD